MTRRWPVFGVVLAVLWLFVRGVPVDPVSGPGGALRDVLGEFLIGLGVGLPVAFVLRRMYRSQVDLRPLPRVIPPALAYVGAFVVELISANFEVAYRVLSPRMPIDPEVVELPLRVESDLGITAIANSITMTPGTLTMDYDENRNTLYVHAIYCDDPEDIVAPIRTWEDYALRIFDEPRDPDDVARNPHVYDPDADREADTADEAADVETAGSKAIHEGGDADGE
jgi:multicomponent Na+:H+ antiporter subunit E